MKLTFVALFGFLILTFSADRASGCDLCAVAVSEHARHDGSIGIFTGIGQQFTSYGTLQIDGNEVSNPENQFLDSSITQLFAGYGFNDQFNVQISLPIIYRNYRTTQAGKPYSDSVSGIGDLSLIANYQPLRIETNDWSIDLAFQGGIKLPTGDSSKLDPNSGGHLGGETEGEHHEPASSRFAKTRKHGAVEHGMEAGSASAIHGHDLALGSGSMDGILGANFNVRYQRFFVEGAVQYAIRSTGSYDYTYANDLLWETGPGVYLALEDEYSVTLQLVLAGEVKGADDADGTSENNAVTTVAIGPSIGGTLGDHLSGKLGVELPVVLENNSLQAMADYRIRAMISWSF